MFITTPDLPLEEMNRITLDHYESKDGKFQVERTGGALELINGKDERHLLQNVGGGFGACGFPF